MTTTTTVRQSSKSAFVQAGTRVALAVGEHTFESGPRAFKGGEGACGWNFSGKAFVTPGEQLTVYVDGLPVTADLARSKSSGNANYHLQGETTVIGGDGTEYAVTINGNVTPTKSGGWFDQDGTLVSIPAGPVQVQVSVNLFVQGSKKWGA